MTYDFCYDVSAYHTIKTSFLKEPDMFCPHCGENHVWVEVGNEDFYVGAEHFCTACGASWTMPSFNTPEQNQNTSEAKIVQQLQYYEQRKQTAHDR